MPLANGSNLSKTYAGQAIFRGVSFEIQERDRVALVGANGAGKTTLMRILAGIERPDGGTVTYATGTRLGYLSQEVVFPPGVTLRQHLEASFQHLVALEAELEQLQEQLATMGRAGDHGPQAEALLHRHDRLQHEFEVGGGYTYQNRLREVIAGLGIEESRLDQPLETFSGGQRTRVALAELLLSGRDLLLLDEPTNHLDLEATEWLEDYLSQASQAVVIVSHDRWFLDKVARRIWEMDAGKLEKYTGNYTQFADQRAERQERQRKEYEAQQLHIAKTEAFIDRYRAGQRARQARGRQKILNRLERVERPREAGAMALAITSTLRSGETVLATEGLAVAVGTPAPTPVFAQPGQPIVREPAVKRPVDESALLFRSDDVELRRGARAAIIGPNGTGKTTLLRIIAGEHEPAAGRVYIGYGVQMAYYAQAHEQLRSTATVISEITTTKPMGEEAARTYLGRFLFRGDDVFKSVRSLSGGERSRLALAKLALGNANLLILDEPTNHLDLYSREALEEVLQEFAGTILFVSHDRYLIDALATQIWAVEREQPSNGEAGADGASKMGRWRLRVHKQSWGEYVEQRDAAKAAAEAAKRRTKERAAAPVQASQEATRNRARDLARGQARLEKLDAEIASLNAQLHLLGGQLEGASAASDGRRIAEIGQSHHETSQRLHVLEEEWLALHDTVEQLSTAGEAALQEAASR